MEPQVARTHYEFQSYMDKRRWASIWQQLAELTTVRPDSTLEIGPGRGLLKSVASVFDLRVTTLDIDPDLGPDFVGSATALPFSENSFDVVCAFQVLEHLPYDQSLLAMREMCRCASRAVLISLPDAAKVWPSSIYLPLVGPINLHIPSPRLRRRRHIFDGQHYWEVNTRGYELKKVLKQFHEFCPSIRTYRVAENPYHRFFIFDIVQ